jgi:alcohol dehydrogenase
MIDATQAEYVRVPFAENSVYKIPDGVTDAEGILLSDILPTGFEIGVQYGEIRPGDVVAVIGSGPVAIEAVGTPSTFTMAAVIRSPRRAKRPV